MGRRLLRCRNRDCPVGGGAVLGRLTDDGGVVVSPCKGGVLAFLDSGRAEIRCPACGRPRDFLGRYVLVAD